MYTMQLVCVHVDKCLYIIYACTQLRTVLKYIDYNIFAQTLLHLVYNAAAGLDLSLITLH